MRSGGGKGSAHIQPWQIVILVLAAILVLWRVGSYTLEARQRGPAKMVQGEEKNPARPGTKTYQMFEEK